MSAQTNYYLQFKDLYWKMVKNARRYDVTIEKKDSNGNWIFEMEKEVPDTSIQTFLFPGEYRYSIVPINGAGVRAFASDWDYFYISDENEPVFYDRSFSIVKEYDVPIINLRREGPLAYFTIYGKDIYFLDSAFSLVPIDVTDTYMGNYNSYIDNRPEIKLQVSDRNRDLNLTTLVFEYDEIFSGYYNLRVKNPGGIEKTATILIKLDDPITLDLSSEAYDANYKIYTKDLFANEKMFFSVWGKGFDSETIYSLKAQKRSDQYPFTSDLQLNNAILSLANYHYDSRTKNIRLDFLVNPSSILTGYYDFVAEKNGKKYEFPFLLKIDRYSYPEPSIRTLKYKESKLRDTLVIEGENLPEHPTVKIVSQYIPELARNERVYDEGITMTTPNCLQLEFEKGAFKDSVYAIIMETRDVTVKEYFEFRNNVPRRLFLSDSEIASTFLGSIEKKKSVEETKKETSEVKKEEPAIQIIEPAVPETPKKKVVYTKSKMYTKIFLPYGEIGIDYFGFYDLFNNTKGDPVDFSLDVDLCLLNFTIFKVVLPMEYRFANLTIKPFAEKFTECIRGGVDIKLTMPLQVIVLEAPNFTPYVGGKVMWDLYGRENFNVFAGMEFMNIIDFNVSIDAGSSGDVIGLKFSSMQPKVKLGAMIPFSKLTQKKLYR